MIQYTLYDPTVKARYEVSPLARRRGWDDTARVGLLWNSKPNADVLLAAIRERLELRHPALQFVAIDKDSASRPMSTDDFEALRDCDAVVNAIGD